MGERKEKVVNKYTKEVMRQVGRRIYDVRNSLRINQAEFVKPLGISNTTISQIETGSAGPSTALLYQLSCVYDVSIDYILNGEGAMFRHRKKEEIPEKETITTFTTYEDLLWLSENCPLFRAMVTAAAVKLFYENESEIRDNFDKVRASRQKY